MKREFIYIIFIIITVWSGLYLSGLFKSVEDTKLQERIGYDTSGVEQDNNPKITEVCNNEIIGREITPTFKKVFIEKYEYENSKGYCFATYLEGYGYINVFRNHNGGVSNDSKIGLYGCKYANDIYQDTIDAEVGSKLPLLIYKGNDIAVANKSSYGFQWVTIPDDFILTRDMLRSSPTKELSGENIMDYYIKPINKKICNII